MTPSSLAEFVKQRRESFGMNQSEFAEMAGIKRAHLSQIENGRIVLPNADLRRKLANALGVSHLDIMVASGELTSEEAGGADSFSTPVNQNEAWAQEVWAMARAVRWDDSRLNTVMAIFAAWVEEDRTGWRRRRNQIVQGQGTSAPPSRPESTTEGDDAGKAEAGEFDGPPAISLLPLSGDPRRYDDEHGIPRLRLGAEADPMATTDVDLTELFRRAEEAGLLDELRAKRRAELIELAERRSKR